MMIKYWFALPLYVFVAYTKLHIFLFTQIVDISSGPAIYMHPFQSKSSKLSVDQLRGCPFHCNVDPTPTCHSVILESRRQAGRVEYLPLPSLMYAQFFAKKLNRYRHFCRKSLFICTSFVSKLYV